MDTNQVPKNIGPQVPPTLASPTKTNQIDQTIKKFNTTPVSQNKQLKKPKHCNTNGLE